MSDNLPIVVAMSGGVDSSTVAALLHSQGHNIIGVTMQLYDHGQAVKKKNACCAGQDIYDASEVANLLGIPHYVLDYESNFKESVIDNFVESYIHGETPLPCVRCNQSVKFHDLLKFTKDIGAKTLVTGHYVRKVIGEYGAELHKGLDHSKDQSYFLFATTKEQLEYLDFPLGGFSKEETRNLAKRFGLKIFDKPDSQDICFIPDGNYRQLVNKMRPDAFVSGAIMHVDGFEIGKHSGIINYTIGQRKGLGLSYKEPLYVTKIDPQNNIVYVGSLDDLATQKFIIKDVNWISGSEINEDEIFSVKVRSTRPCVSAKLKILEDNKILVLLLSNEYGVAPGQACVIYDNDRVLGGGWIIR